MEPVFLETFRPRYALINRAAGDVDRDWPVKDRIEVGDRFGTGQLLYACVDDTKRCSVMSGNGMSLFGRNCSHLVGLAGAHKGARSERCSIFS
jgi:hypothetical protein